MKLDKAAPSDPIKEEIAGFILGSLQEMGITEQLEATNIVALLEQPKDTSHGDIALPCFIIAKLAKKSPMDLSALLSAKCNSGQLHWVKQSTATGPFLNFALKPEALAQYLIPQILEKKLFGSLVQIPKREKRVMIEYSQPNTHKDFHVGHMRNVALGDSLVRLYRYCGYDVTAANYIGDEGAHVAKCLWYLTKFNKKAPAQGRGSWLGDMYMESSNLLEDASPSDLPSYQEEIAGVLKEIEKKSGRFYDLWLETKSWSMDIFYEIYDWLGSKFDHYFFESEVSEESQEIVDEYLSKGVFIESDGAIGMDLKAYKAGFAIFRKRDGNTLYATKDLALARRKFRDFKIDKSIYVVASEQNLHFKQVFKALELMGFPQATNCYHLSYALVMLEEGKMSSRKGNVVTFYKLKQSLEDELQKQLEKYKDSWSAEEIADVRRKLCVGAIKFGMIFSDPNKEIIFKIQDWLSFDGCTGPYLMYSYARSQSILSKGKENDWTPALKNLEALKEQEEADLLKQMYTFNDVVWQACQNNKPSVLAHYLFDLCKSFNRLHKNVPILKAETDDLRSARLALIQAFGSLLFQGISLLGFEPPKRM
ncbi:MAG: arginine--tRNA ligase [Oligoflexales bacterium]